MVEIDQLIYDWNASGSKVAKVMVLDESLRDGIQSPSVTDPSIEEKIQLLHLLDQLGVHYITLGFPAVSRRAYDDVLRLAQEIIDQNLKIKPTCAGRMTETDIRPILDISQKTGLKIEVMIFLASSSLRSLIERSDETLLVERTAKMISLLVQSGNPVTYVTEDATRSKPSTLEKLFKVALDYGAKGLCLCDTVGHATPDGAKRLVEFTRKVVDQVGVKAVIDWHGHNDRGLALSNALAAATAGADRIHGTVLGVGERAGNTPLDQLLINLKLQDQWEGDLMLLGQLCDLATQTLNSPMPVNYPGLGRDAFRTATGVHASAILKASSSPEHAYLVDLVYSGVPAAMLGREQEVDISHMSGASNVLHWFKRHGVMPTKELVDAILCLAKSMNRSLTTQEIMEAVQLYQPITY